MTRFLYFTVVMMLHCIAAKAQCSLGTGSYTQANIFSCLSGCTNGCTINIQDGATVNMDGDWNLLSIQNLNLTVLGSGSLVFSGSGGNADQLFLSETSVITIDDTSNGNAITSSNNGNVFIEIGDREYKGGEFDEIIMAGGADSTGPQPIELASFDAIANGDLIQIIWSTYSESNNDYFSIEKSIDGINYSLLTTVNGAGNSTKLLSYSYEDRNPSFGRSYYRLKQTDFDGASETFSPVLVDFTSLPNGKLTFTNPVQAGNSITIFSNSSNEELLSFSLYNMLGAKVVSAEFTGSEYVFRIDSNVRPGVYFVKVFSSISEQTGRLIIQ